MAINVTCAACHTRFNVSDQFAGKKGPCPKCKAEITIPKKTEEVVIHAPQAFGPKDSKGRSVLKPIFREEPKFSPLIAGIIGVAVLGVILLALMLRFTIDDKAAFPGLILAGGALLLAPLLSYAGYMALRSDDFAPHKGQGLWIRIGVCSIVYALLWALLSLVNVYVFDGEGISTGVLAVIVPLMVLGGAGVASLSLDLDYFNGLFHYGFYLLVTILLRVLVGISALPYET